MLAGPSTAKDLGSRIARVFFCEGFREKLMAVFCGVAFSGFHRCVAALTKETITDCLMVLALPGGVQLDLGQHLNYAFPGAFGHIQVSDLRELLDRYEPSANAKD